MTRIEKAPNLSSNLRSVPKSPSMFALEHFDDFYRKIFGNDWHSIRLALLSKSKFCAVVSNFTEKVFDDWILLALVILVRKTE